MYYMCHWILKTASLQLFVGMCMLNEYHLKIILITGDETNQNVSSIIY